MTDDATSVWPRPQTRFVVLFPDLGAQMHCQEVSGLDNPPQVLDYRAGGAPQMPVAKMPGMLKGGAVTLKRAILPTDSPILDWYRQSQMRQPTRQTVTIRLLDETGATLMEWALSDVWPTQITGSDVTSDGTGIAIDSLKIAHLGLTIQTP